MSTQINCFFQIIDRRLSGSFSQLIVFWFCMKVEIAFSIPARGMREKYSFLSIHWEVTLATPASKAWILTQKLQHDDLHHWRGVVGLHSQKEISTYLLLQLSLGFAFARRYIIWLCKFVYLPFTSLLSAASKLSVNPAIHMATRCAPAEWPVRNTPLKSSMSYSISYL